MSGDGLTFAGPDRADPAGATDHGDRFKNADHVGDLVAFADRAPARLVESKANNRPSLAVPCGLIVAWADEGGPPTVYLDQLAFGAVVVPDLGAPAAVIVGRVAVGVATAGRNPPHVLIDPDPADMDQARAWFAEHVTTTDGGALAVDGVAVTRHPAPPARNGRDGDPGPSFAPYGPDGDLFSKTRRVTARTRGNRPANRSPPTLTSDDPHHGEGSPMPTIPTPRDTQGEPVTPLVAALDCAARGWPVVPIYPPSSREVCACAAGARCRAVGKHPVVWSAAGLVHGFEAATVDPEVIGRWWRQLGPANIGLRCGVGFDVFDIDDPAALDALTARRAGPTAAPGPVVETGRGWHFYVPVGSFAGRVAAVAGVDLKRSGIVIAPPSRHRTGAVYRWRTGHGPDRPLVELPPWATVEAPPPLPVRTYPGPVQGEGGGGFGVGSERWWQGRLHHAARRVWQAPSPGGHNSLRNEALGFADGVASGVLVADDVVGALVDARAHRAVRLGRDYWPQTRGGDRRTVLWALTNAYSVMRRPS